MLHKYKWLFISFLSFILVSCDEPKSDKVYTTFDSGEVTIYCDQTMEPVVSAQLDVFHHAYPKAKINMMYASENEVVRNLISGTAKMGILGRELNADEKKAIEPLTITPRHLAVARDGIALLLNRQNADTSFSYEEVLSILQGKAETWATVRPKNKLGKVAIVFDQQGSATVNYVTSLFGGGALPANAYAVKSNDAVVDYVSKNSNSLGLIGWSYISDTDDAEMMKRRSEVRTATLSPRDTLQGKAFFKPTPYNLGTYMYPLYRDVVVVNCEGYNGLATGFLEFLGSDRGQRIFQQAGLVQLFAPGRAVHFNSFQPDIKVVE